MLQCFTLLLSAFAISAEPRKCGEKECLRNQNIEIEHADGLTAAEVAVQLLQKKSESKYSQFPEPVPIRIGKPSDIPALNVATRGAANTAFEVPLVNDGRARPMNCTGHGKPIQLMKKRGGFAIWELEIESGKYKLLFDIPFESVRGFFSDINACGINPKDGIIYCAMHTALTSYLVRLSPGTVEFVAKLKSWQIYNTGGFSPDGVYFLANNTAHFIVINKAHELKGSNDKNDPKLLNLADVQSHKPRHWSYAADVVTFKRDLEGTGEEQEYITSLYGRSMQIAKWSGTGFSESWVIPTSQGDWGDIWGAGWSFNGRIFFAANDGDGVFEILLEDLNVRDPNSTATLKLVGRSDRAATNDGMNCLFMPDPWVTRVYPFDCENHGAPLQVTRSASGVSIKKVSLESGFLTDIYDIPWKRTEPKFRFLNGVGINPIDHIPYGALMTEKSPGDMYIVRFDSEKIEFVAKLTGSFNPIAGTFDASGNFFFLSHPDFGNGTLYKIAGLDIMQGFVSPTNASLTDLSRLPGVLIDEMYQMADIVAISYDMQGSGNLTDYILGINRDQQVIVVKWSNDNQSQIWRFYTNNVLGKYGAKLNFGAAWNFQGRLMFASNDGVGVFEATAFDTITGYVKLVEIGKSSSVEFTDGFNCPSASPFWGNATDVIKPKVNFW